MAPAGHVRTVVGVDLAPPPADAPTQPPPGGSEGHDETERLFGGVAALLADRLGVEALWVRIAFVLLALVGGIGLVVYGAMWLAFIIGADPDRRWARVAGGAVLVVGLPLVLTAGFDFFSGPVAVLALLLGLAVALWQPRAGPAPRHGARRRAGIADRDERTPASPVRDGRRGGCRGCRSARRARRRSSGGWRSASPSSSPPAVR